MERFLEAMAASLNGPEADGRETTLNFVFTDIDESYVLTLENAVLHHKRGDPDPAERKDRRGAGPVRQLQRHAPGPRAQPAASGRARDRIVPAS